MAGGTPSYRRKEKESGGGGRSKVYMTPPSPKSEQDLSLTRHSQTHSRHMLTHHKQIFKDLIQQKYDAQARILDANFISVYDEKEQKYFYYVERLLGKSIEFEQSQQFTNLHNELNLFDNAAAAELFQVAA